MSISGSKESFERICIVGPGAMGLLHAVYLKRAGLDVHLLDHNPARARSISESKVLVQIEEQIEVLEVPCHSTPDFGPVDLIIFFVKAYSTAAAAEHAAPLIGQETVLLTLQNGLGNLEIIEQYQRLERVLAGTTTSGATLLEMNLVRQEGLGDVQVGSPVGNRDLAGELVEVFQQALLPARVVDNLLGTIWRKAVINAAINPLTAITGLENGQLLEQRHLRLLLAELATEAAAAAESIGIDVNGDDITVVVEDVCRLTAHNRSSMLQDITHCRRTEIEQINGEFVRAGIAGSVTTPLNRAMVALVKALEVHS
ncbi:MAG: ketopantoate reductase family protein [Armatimonadota bacterium]